MMCDWTPTPMHFFSMQDHTDPGCQDRNWQALCSVPLGSIQKAYLARRYEHCSWPISLIGYVSKVMIYFGPLCGLWEFHCKARSCKLSTIPRVLNANEHLYDPVAIAERGSWEVVGYFGAFALSNLSLVSASREASFETFLFFFFPCLCHTTYGVEHPMSPSRLCCASGSCLKGSKKGRLHASALARRAEQIDN
ncbi:uncharacterized protein CIMG_13442 [Coccidioides immitis RS]|uniref:Uncharacterized protein n=2 Tax=Coccidioides TaxID=5500 RepID=A0A0D8JXZ2_COCIM|nr:uncharacterized protein CIMG_13442 [Coccidioides immitis RS]EFW17657.1 hypothetical protein CPSG_06100 [Coccidioides posadasii str. Silveira]KJF61123.1 hypothetical protein CIMG_13442 [Coccidioides immitis RS]